MELIIRTPELGPAQKASVNIFKIRPNAPQSNNIQPSIIFHFGLVVWVSTLKTPAYFFM